MTGEDPIPNWRLAEFNDNGATPFLKLTPRGTQPGPTDAVYFYEVNYSALAGVIRNNQPLDITGLFVGLDLAVNVARARLRVQPPPSPVSGEFNVDNGELARHVQKLAGVFVAATVPILGLPSLILRKYTETFVSTFIRFFEDVATFALDKNGEKLISAHVDRTIDNIVGSASFQAGDTKHADDVFVIAAHSLGTIVIHNFIVRNWTAGGRKIPSSLLTFGSPIGLVCWMWLFLDYPRMQFKPEEPTGTNYFCWTPEAQEAAPTQAIQWINVVNHLDPIATTFPPDYVNLGHTPGANARVLENGRVEHRVIRTGGIGSAGAAHTEYFDDRHGFLEILGRLAQIRDGDPLGPAAPLEAAHWTRAGKDLRSLRWASWAMGTAFVAVYLGAISHAYEEPRVLLLLSIYAWPPATIAVLAFFQRLLFGGPTKRTYVERIASLPWLDIAAFPYRLRRGLGLGRENPPPMAAGPGAIEHAVMRVVSFVPAAAAMAMPVFLAVALSDKGPGMREFLEEHLLETTVLLLVFVLYLLAFAVSELVARWRAIVMTLAHH
jgi:hypothetical protein